MSQTSLTLKILPPQTLNPGIIEVWQQLDYICVCVGVCVYVHQTSQEMVQHVCYPGNTYKLHFTSNVFKANLIIAVERTLRMMYSEFIFICWEDLARTPGNIHDSECPGLSINGQILQ